MNKIYYDNIIIGSGPAGLQLAYFYKILNINYIILEKEQHVGTFFDKYPLSSSLISINKSFTSNKSSDFNLRHDWNSLLNYDDFLFKKYSSDYFPNSNDLFKYLNEFNKEYELNINFGVDVNIINKSYNKDYNYELTIKDNPDNIYICKNLICATGLSKQNIPDITMNVKNKIKHYGDFKKSDFEIENLKKYEDKKVLIIGGGNAAYEIANMLKTFSNKFL